MEETMVKEPPVVLVKTWINLLKQKDDIAAQRRSEQMLMSAFENTEALAKYLKKHGIK